ncbi:hypothetical protein ACODM8_18555 [Vibrio ostreicida]|uniref:DUF2946 domain-containing protein n=1 Tax=Vibrio ostreicida TaxID=526588 RepID=A0ABT8BXJ1_9VIBR|nr:hypothetical protein [Vibrio ostreicida]MDN3611865.1 hypothetical protein [Vibrio ostreicida]NPD09671.1 hypothetical protein [Vibrio ostreicida]
MLCASMVSWLLVSLMPVINAYGANAGVWATLCTLNGFELVQIEEGTPNPSHSKPCPFAHYSSFHQDGFLTPVVLTLCSFAPVDSYAFLALNTRYQWAIVRAPPRLSLG